MPATVAMVSSRTTHRSKQQRGNDDQDNGGDPAPEGLYSPPPSGNLTMTVTGHKTRAVFER